MNGFIRNFAVVKVICHFILTSIWLYWGICVHPLTTGWVNWTILICGSLLYFFGGAICLILDDESDIRNEDDHPLWAFGYSLINIFLLGCMIYYTGLYPDNNSLLICPTIFIATTLLLSGFNGTLPAFLLVFISVSLWLSNWGINRWYDYFILIGALIIAFFSISVTSFKYDDDSKRSVKYWIINFVFCSFVNLGILSLLYFNKLLDINNTYNILYLTAGSILFLLVVTTRLITLLLVVAAGIFFWRDIDFIFLLSIPDLSFEWINYDWVKWSIGVSSSLLIIILLIRYYNRKIETQREAYTKRTNQLEDIIRNNENIIRQLKETSILPIEYKGLTMTCPNCRKTMVRGKYAESTVRGVAKTTTKGLIKTGSVGTFTSIGLALDGPIGALGGAAIGEVITFFANKPIDKGVDAVIDLWNYEVDGGRTVYFKCPRHECGHEWTRIESYGEIEH